MFLVSQSVNLLVNQSDIDIDTNMHVMDGWMDAEWYEWCKNKALLSSAYALRQYGLQLDEEDRKGCHGDAAACLRDARDHAVQARGFLAKVVRLMRLLLQQLALGGG